MTIPRASPKSSERAAMLAKGKKWCAACLRWRSLRLFTTHNGTADGKRCYCMSCVQKKRLERIARVRGMVDETAQARWDALVDKSPQWNGCWRWIGNTRRGYGRFTYQSNHHASARNVGLELATGYVTTGNEQLRNSCGNRWCVFPEHLTFPAHKNVPKLTSKRGKTLRRKRDTRILAGIEAALPANVPPEVRDEMRQELAVACFVRRAGQVGTITPTRVKRALAAAWAAQGDPFGLSIDTPIGDDELTYRDVLPDHSIFSDPCAIVEAARALAGD